MQRCGLNAVCNTTRPVDKARGRKLRLAVYVQATQVARYTGGEEAREGIVHHLHPDSAVAGNCRPLNYDFGGGKDSYAVEGVATDSTAAAQKHAAPSRLDAHTVVVKAGIV